MNIAAITNFVNLYPRLSIIAFALIMSFLISIVNYFVLDKDRLREIKGKQKALQEEAKQHRDNPDKLMEINKEIMTHSMEMMRHSFKPMLITFIPIVLLFGYVRGLYGATAIASSWFWYYIGASIAGSIFFRKILNLP